MVERLKEAIEKARLQRNAGGASAAPPTPAPPAQTALDAPDAWRALPALDLDPAHLARERIVTRDKTGSEHIPFDVLRTRLGKIAQENGWSRIGIASPTKGCGKSFVCANLAFSFARNAALRTVVLDLDLKRPRLAESLGVRSPFAIADFLLDRKPLAETMVRASDNLAFGLNTAAVRDSAEMMASERAAASIDAMRKTLAPHIVLFDLPPIFASDDTLAFLANVDALMLVAAAGATMARDIAECERLLSGQTEFLGVVLNKVEESGIETYQGEYAEAHVST